MQNLEKILKDQYFMHYYLKYFITEMAKSNLEMERLSTDKIETNKIINIYEKEARFHIEFVRIQPFEDGNKRTARIITNYNLYRQNLPPIIIEGIEIKKYFSYINNYDIDGFTEFIRQKSTEEYQRIISLYNFLCDNNFINKKDDNMEKEDKIIKKIVKDLKINL